MFDHNEKTFKFDKIIATFGTHLASVCKPTSAIFNVQGGQLNMSVFFWFSLIFGPLHCFVFVGGRLVRV